VLYVLSPSVACGVDITSDPVTAVWVGLWMCATDIHNTYISDETGYVNYCSISGYTSTSQCISFDVRWGLVRFTSSDSLTGCGV